ncbi:MAG TPA: glycosyltransferase family 39 protein [Xanthobacteraceae bacterium]|nr:glycosyltransferase family 39 protein [Xanthobacteraceae bacterium]
MSIAGRDATDQSGSRIAGVVERLTRAAQAFVAETAEGTIVFLVLAAFVVLWMIFWSISTAPLDANIDSGEASVWAQHFAFGYKHPPMTAWLFKVWFALFPRQRWAMDLLTVTTCACGLAVAWRLLRDHLDKNRALLGLVALILVPLYDIKAEVLNANTVMIPFWAATLLFYLRARRGLGVLDAFLAGAFASLTLLGKYWAVFLFAGMAVAAFVGPGTRRFWRSPAPYVMAAGAIIVIAPHVWWLVSEHGGGAIQFAASVATGAPFGETLMKTISYVVGAVMYIAVPLAFFAALRPSRAALADTAWPSDEIRRQAVVLLLVPLVLPALLNLIIPYRLTPDWTFPDWALLPLVLYSSPLIAVDSRAMARAGLVGLALVLAVIIASPAIAYVRFKGSHDRDRMYSRQIAEMAEGLAGQPITRIWGSPAIVAGLPFYLPQAKPYAGTSAGSVLIVCLSDDLPCQKGAAAFAHGRGRTVTATFARHFLGLSGRPETFQLTVLPQAPSSGSDRP